MKTKIDTSKLNISILFKFWIVQFSFILLVITVFYLVAFFGDSVTEYLKSVGVMALALPIVNSLVSAYSARKHTITITEVDNPAQLASWAIELLLLNGMNINSELKYQTVLEPKSNFLKWFGNRFGTELAIVSYTENQVTIAGNFKYIDIIDTKIKFGRVAI